MVVESDDGVHPLPREAREVLTFWFGGEQAENYRSKWFPPEASEKQQRMDALIVSRFSELLQRAERRELEQQGWTQQRVALVALIVVLDQFSRHVYRAHEDKTQLLTNDARALQLAQELVARGWHTDLEVPQFVFALMPLRHSPTPERLHAVLDAVAARETLQRAHVDLLEKFRRTTQNRLLHLPSGGGGSSGAPLVAASDADILERHFVETDEHDMPKHRLYKAMHAYLTAMHAKEHAYMAVSLSGGVDSMVVAYLLHKLRPLHNDFGVVAVHLDYGNRDESAAECAYVQQWCARFGIACHARRIDEVKRATTKRDDYERISRDIRYATYATVLAQYGAPGMCFGHHRGDVQENVISNMMKGLSLLGLNGMSAASVVNGVSIWRPLLDFDKDAIFEFAHRYGVPYFKDTTPAWSTRGKLRTQLVPLLAELYGDGFLNNVSTLGAESTQCGELITHTVLAPILATVRTSQVAVWLDCSALVAQPFFVWKEVLRSVCHDVMGNSMVREKPIRELITKLARHAGRRDDAMWITLKKGNRSFITQRRELIIFRDNFFRARAWPPHSTAQSAAAHTTEANVATDAVLPPVSSVSAATAFRVEVGETYSFGSWTVSTELVESESEVVTMLRDREPLTMWDVIQSDGVAYVIPNAPVLTLSSEKRIPVLKRLEKPITDFMPLVAAVSRFEDHNSDADADADAGTTTKWVYVQLRYCNVPPPPSSSQQQL